MKTGIANAGSIPSSRISDVNKNNNPHEMPAHGGGARPTRIVFSCDMGGLCTDMVDEEVANICAQACNWFSSDPANNCEVVDGAHARDVVRRMLVETCCHEEGKKGTAKQEAMNARMPCVSHECDMELMYSNAQLARIEAETGQRSTGKRSNHSGNWWIVASVVLDVDEIVVGCSVCMWERCQALPRLRTTPAEPNCQSRSSCLIACEIV
jgi:hypothetical protein